MIVPLSTSTPRHLCSPLFANHLLALLSGPFPDLSLRAGDTQTPIARRGLRPGGPGYAAHHRRKVH